MSKVEYNIYTENQTVADTRVGKLFPNVKGCGYPPIVECDGNPFLSRKNDSLMLDNANVHHYSLAFAKTFGELGRNFTCFYSSLDPELVISRLDYEEVTRSLLYSLAIPLPVFSLAVCYLVFAYLYIYRNNKLDSRLIRIKPLFGSFCLLITKQKHREQLSIKLIYLREAVPQDSILSKVKTDCNIIIH